MELGLPSPGAAPTAAGPAAPAVEPEAVRDALRSLGVPAELARSPLATGDGIEARAASVRALLEAGARKRSATATTSACSPACSPAATSIRRPATRSAADELNLSRAAYFRRLKQASERLAEYLAGATFL